MNPGSSRIPHTRNAPAKINLGLHVIRRRDDGFHEIDTIMAPLRGLCDVLTFSESDEFRFTCCDPELPTNEENLVVRAAHAFAMTTGLPCNLHIHLQKHIPSGAGLGGGSSDAAATLRALQEIHGNPLDQPTLHKIAASIGSDVPFFLQDAPARCTGRGEVVTPVPEMFPSPIHVLLLKPSFPVITADAYRGVLDPAPIAVSGHAKGSGRTGGLGFLDSMDLSNDLEGPVFAKHRFLAELALWLHDRPETLFARMSGSGSTVFAILNPSSAPEAIARAATQELDSTLWHWHGLAC